MPNMESYAQRLAAKAPGDAAFTACIKKATTGEVQVAHTSTLADATGRLDGENAKQLWKNGKSTLQAAALAAACCKDPDVLLQMVKKEKRQGVLGTLLYNPAISLEALLIGYPKVGYNQNRQEKSLSLLIKEKVWAEEMNQELIETCLNSDVLPAVAAVHLHPGLTPECAVMLLDASWTGVASHLLQREDLPQLGADVVARLLETGERYMVDGALARRSDLLELGEEALQRVLTSPLSWEALTGRDDLTPEMWQIVVDTHQTWIKENKQSHYRQRAQTWHWDEFAANESFPSHLLDQAPVSYHLPGVMARRLSEEFGDDAEKWETALGLVESMQERSIGEVITTISALYSK